MGIPRLTRHLMPFSDDVMLGGKSEHNHDDLVHISSIVIDGPSLVYHIFSRLLCLSNRKIDHADVQPTCNEVSSGVAVYLLTLMMLGVKIEKICFDGALPFHKRETRLSRLEKGRKKLEEFRSITKNGFMTLQTSRSSWAVDDGRLFLNRPLPAKLINIPDNPFIVPAVFEDLKTRWNKESLRDVAGNLAAHATLSDFPWAAVTVMVQGEADTHCAHVAKATNSAVLTNDSDLILHDIGFSGSVILCSSIEVTQWDRVQPEKSQIRAARLCPAVIAERLGVVDLLSLAYEVKAHPNMGLTELVQRVKTRSSGYENDTDFQKFSEEYCCERVDKLQKHPLLQHLDIRVAELFWQYAKPLTFAGTEAPQVYLPILTEDHSRRCAWVEGRRLRSLGYAILNASHPKSQRYPYVSEFVRRGGRIIVDPIPLVDDSEIEREMSCLRSQLAFVQESCRQKLVSLAHWRIFALWYILSEFSLESATDPGVVGQVPLSQTKLRQLTKFLIQGHMNERLGWMDIHLGAQIQSVLYSLRVFRQLLEFLKPSNTSTAHQLKSTLDSLPPLHSLTRPIHRDLGQDSCVPLIRQLVRIFIPLSTKGASGEIVGAEDTLEGQRSSSPRGAGSTAKNGTANPYELLAME